MTLRQAVTRLRTRFEIDLDAEFDVENDAECVRELMVAAKEVSRDSYLLWTWKAALTLITGEPEYNLLTSTVCAKPVFHPYLVYLNGVELVECQWDEFVAQNPNYFSASNNSNPWCWVRTPPSIIRLADPPNATAVAYSNNFVVGAVEHDEYNITDHENIELQGPKVMHDLIVDKCFLNNSKSYVADTPGYARRANTEKAYNEKTEKFQAENKSRYRKLRIKATAGLTRRTFGPGDAN